MRYLAGLLVIVGLLGAQQKSGFQAWWPQFQAAVAKGDASFVARNVSFPMQWEDGATRDVRSEEEFVTHFNMLMTADIRRQIARGKLFHGRDGSMITWKARGNEYSLYFKDRGKGFALDGLSEGPP